MYQGHGYYMSVSASGTYYGMYVSGLSSTGITLSYAAANIGYHISAGALVRGSAYVRVIAYELCANSVAPTDTPIPTDTLIPTDKIGRAHV